MRFVLKQLNTFNMGCDIHLYGEKKVKPKWFEVWKKEKWVSVDKWTSEEDDGMFGDGENRIRMVVVGNDRIYTDGRNYNLFCALAGVRRHNFYEPHHILSEPKGIPLDSCNEIQSEVDRWGTDGHSHSYLTLREIQEFDWSPYGETVKHFLNEVPLKLLSFSTNPDNVRIVFFFDN